MNQANSTFCFMALLVVLNCSTAAAQQTKSAAHVLPDSTVAFAEISNPSELIDDVLEHPVAKLIQDNEQFKQFIASPEFATAFLGKSILENQIDDTLLNSLRTNLANGLFLAYDERTDGLAVLFESKSEEKLKRLAGSALKIIAAQAEREGKEIPFKKETYRDASVAEFEGMLIARYKTWFLVSNKPKLAKNIVDNLHDGTSKSLAKQNWFVSASKKRTSTDAWAAINLEAIRAAEKTNELFSGRTSNPGVELVFGGVLDALQHAPLGLAELDLEKDLQLSVSMPFNEAWANESREFFFGHNLQGRGPVMLTPKNSIANLTSHRDIGGWWLSKEDLFEENVIAQLAQADSQLSTIFSGMDFGQDVLGALEPGVQIVIAENEFEKKHTPDIQLPSFALVGKLKDADKIQRKLKIAFQSVIGFANINLGMEGQPQLDLETETIGETKISSASYVYDDEVEQGLLLFNFAPTIAFRGKHLVISSSRELALELVKLTAASDQSGDSNTLMRIEGKSLNRILKLNREALVAQNMLENGHSRKSAEQEIDSFLAIAALFKESEIDFRVEPDEMKLDLTIKTID